MPPLAITMRELEALGSALLESTKAVLDRI
jgi:hypothetical protein